MKQSLAIRMVLSHARHHDGVITFAEAEALGIHPRQLQTMLAVEVLVRVHRGVYVEATRANDALVKMAAAAAYVGPSGVLSHRSAAWLQGLLDAPGEIIHMTIGHKPSERYRGIKLHQAQVLPSSLAYKGIRCTMPARTIVDVAPSLSMPAVNAMVDKALVDG